MDIKQNPGPLPPVHEAWLPREHPLHRPRHGRKQTGALVSALIFFTIPLLLFVLGVRPAAIENRAPAGFPSLADGWGFFTGLNPWASDNLPLRDAAIHANGDISTGLFGEDPQFDTNNGNSPLGPVGPVVPPNQQSEAGVKTRASGFPVVITGKDGWMYLGYDTEGKCRPPKTLDEIIGTLGQLKTAVEASGRKFVLVIAPDKSTMLPEHLPDSYVGKECAADRTPLFWRRAVSELNIVDVRQTLNQAARGGDPIFFKQDSHWTYLGAVTMTRALVDRLKPGTTSTWDVEKTGTRSRPADLPPLLGRNSEETVPVYSLGPDGGRDRTNWITQDFRPSASFAGPVTTGMIGGKVAMVADSYTNLSTPYLAAAFGDITISHVDQLDKDLTGVQNRMIAADTVVVEVVERVISAGSSPLVDPQIVATIGRVLAGHPVR